ncbi:MAG: EamA family transporter [Micromonosporaceae bacterium]|nr:EamA family transporter [Micromonosporaceae bacterium]
MGRAPDRPDTRRFIVPGFIALGATWGSSFLFIKVGVAELHPVYVTLGRVALGAITMLALVALLRDRLPRSPRVWAHLAVVGTIGVALPFTLFGYGEQRIPSLLAGIWNATTPLVALPLAALVFRTEKLTVRNVTGIAVGFAGVLVVLGVWNGAGGAMLSGQLMCFAASACYGVAIAYLKRFVTTRQSSGLALVAGQMLVATAVMAVIAPLAAGGAPPAMGQLSGQLIASMLALGILGTGFAHLIHYRNIRLVGASAASLVTYLVPLFAMLIGVIVLSESLTWYQPVGTLVVFSGIAITQGLPLRRRRPRLEPATTTAPAAPAPAPGVP